jgi:hypothetical protein
VAEYGPGSRYDFILAETLTAAFVRAGFQILTLLPVKKGVSEVQYFTRYEPELQGKRTISTGSKCRIRLCTEKNSWTNRFPPVGLD